MDTTVAAVAQYFVLNDTLFERAIAGLSDEELRRFPVGEANPMWWLAGHVAASRGMLAAMLDGASGVGYPELFGQKSQPSADAPYPPIAEVHQALKDAGARLRARFEAMTDADLQAPAPRRFPIGDPTLRGAIVFLAYHESYHVGQMAYVRKCLGYPGIVDAQ